MGYIKMRSGTEKNNKAKDALLIWLCHRSVSVHRNDWNIYKEYRSSSPEESTNIFP